MKKTTFLLIVLTVTGLLMSSIHLSLGQTSTPVNGIITQDTTWTKTNSPYDLTGPLAVKAGTTLTIQPGTTVNLYGYYIQVNGTLRAIGKDIDKINFNDGKIIFSDTSTSWDSQTGFGSIIENAIVTSNSIAIQIWNQTPKINCNFIDGEIWINASSPIISGNFIKVSSGIAIAEGSPIILNNTIKGGIGVDDSAAILNNTLEGNGQGNGIGAGSNAYISDNIISGFEIGLYIGDSVVQRNVIKNNHDGILTQINANPLIRNNTIVNNSIGVTLPGYSTIGQLINHNNIRVNFNNIHDNTNYNIYLGPPEDGPAKDNVNATYNWWGTNQVQTVNETIHDEKNDFNLGTVDFIPFLNAPNPQAVPNLNAAIETANTSPSPSSTPVIEFPFLEVIIATIMLIILGSVLFRIRKGLRI